MPYERWFKSRAAFGLMIFAVMLIIEGVRHLMGLPPIGDHTSISQNTR